RAPWRSAARRARAGAAMWRARLAPWGAGRSSASRAHLGELANPLRRKELGGPLSLRPQGEQPAQRHDRAADPQPRDAGIQEEPERREAASVLQAEERRVQVAEGAVADGRRADRLGGVRIKVHRG